MEVIMIMLRVLFRQTFLHATESSHWTFDRWSFERHMTNRYKYQDLKSLISLINLFFSQSPNHPITQFLIQSFIHAL